MYMLDSFLIGIQKSYLSFINAVIDSLFFKIIISIILEKHIGFLGIYLSMALSPIIPAFIGIIYFLIFIKKYRLNN